MRDFKFCDSCGNKLSITALFCPRCGQKQEIIPVTESVSPSEKIEQDTVDAQVVNEEKIADDASVVQEDQVINEEPIIDNAPVEEPGSADQVAGSGIEKTDEPVPEPVKAEDESPAEPGSVEPAAQQPETQQPTDTYTQPIQQPVQEPRPVVQPVTQPQPQPQQAVQPTPQPAIPPQQPIQPQPQYQAPYYPQAQTYAAAPQAGEAKKKKFPWFFAIVWFILLVAVGIWAYFLLVSPDYDYPRFTEDAQRIALFTASIAALIYTLSLKLAMRRLKALPTVILVVLALAGFFFFCLVELQEGDFLHDTVANIIESISP